MKYFEKLKAMLASRRFQAAVIAVTVVVFQDILGMDEQQATTIAALVMSWIVGDSITKTQ